MSWRALIVVCLLAILAGVGGASWSDASLRRTIREREAMLAQRREELRPLAAVAAEVDRYQQQKKRLQQQIDVIVEFEQTNPSLLAPLVATQRIASLADIDIERIVIDDGLDVTLASTEQAAAVSARMADFHAVIRGSSVFRVTSAEAEGADFRMRWVAEEADE